MQLYTDVIVRNSAGKVLLVDRAVAPFGWALPGGILDSAETPARAAVREVLEETKSLVRLEQLFAAYPFLQSERSCSALTLVYVADFPSEQPPQAGDDARAAKWFSLEDLPPLISAHEKILADYLHFLRTGERPHPAGSLQTSKCDSAKAAA